MTGRARPSGRGAPPGAAPVLRVRDLSFAYPDGQRALERITLDVHAGEHLAVLGPNGAGKSTLCLHLNGILLPQHGEVAVAGLTVTARTAADARRRVGLVFQDPDDMLFMPSVRDDVAFGPANQGLTGEAVAERVDRALAQVGMAAVADRPAHHLSFGQRKRVAIAAVLAMQPDVLVLDEPSANLDPRARRELGTFLDGLDLTVVLVTHDLPFAAQHCERSVILDRGRVVADGPTGGILADDALLAAHDLELPWGFSAPRVPVRRHA